MKKKPVEISEESRRMVIEKLPGYFLILCIVITFMFLLNILSSFVTVLSVSAVLVVSFYPIHKGIVKLFRGRNGLASFVSCLLVVLIIIIPIAVFVLMMTSEAVGAYQVIQDKVNSGFFDKFLQWKSGGLLYDLKNQIAPVINLDGLDVKQNIISVAQNLSGFLVAQTTNILKSLSGLLLGLVFMLFSMFYFFKDGDKIIELIGHYSPLPAKHEAQLFEKLRAMVNGIIKGQFLTGIIQGLAGGLGFWIAGISNPIFWTAIMAFLSFVPVVGAGLVWLPAGIILIAMGEYTWGIFILVWGVLVISTLDNFTRPYLVGGKAHVYPLLTFFVIIGAVFQMGFSGLIIGPLVLMAFISLMHIYEIEYGRLLEK